MLHMKEELAARYKLWISRGSRRSIFGDGKYELLVRIRRTCSIRKAASELGYSYRKAWGDIREAERGIGVKLVIRVRGGSEGGSSVLTDKCIKMLEAYSKFRKAVDRKVEESFLTYLKEQL
jgi:molybdate transport repressor ModE-like protein